MKDNNSEKVKGKKRRWAKERIKAEKEEKGTGKRWMVKERRKGGSEA